MTKQEKIKPIQMTLGTMAFPYSPDGLLKDEEIRKYVCIRFNREPTKEELEYMVILTEKQYAARIKERDERIMEKMNYLSQTRDNTQYEFGSDFNKKFKIEELSEGYKMSLKDLEQIMKGEEI